MPKVFSKEELEIRREKAIKEFGKENICIKCEIRKKGKNKTFFCDRCFVVINASQERLDDNYRF